MARPTWRTPDSDTFADAPDQPWERLAPTVPQGDRRKKRGKPYKPRRPDPASPEPSDRPITGETVAAPATIEEVEELARLKGWKVSRDR